MATAYVNRLRISFLASTLSTSWEQSTWCSAGGLFPWCRQCFHLHLYIVHMATAYVNRLRVSFLPSTLSTSWEQSTWCSAGGLFPWCRQYFHLHLYMVHMGCEEFISVSNFPPLIHGRPDRNFLGVSNVYAGNTIRTSVNGGGGVFFPNGQCWTRGGSKKSLYGRTSLMDDSLFNIW